MAAEFGKLLYLENVAESDDPYKGEMMVKRLGTMDRPDVYYFEVPEDKRSLKLEECRFTYELDVPSNYVPDNSLHAKVIRRIVLAFHDQRTFDSFDLNEYSIFNLAKIKLNESDDAQNLELFPMGHFDARELHARELNDSKNRLVRNGLTIVQNRQQYAEKIWQSQREKINFSTASNQPDFDFEREVHRYSIRAPISHGLASQRRVIPIGTKTSIEVELNTNAHFLMELDEYQYCRTAFNNISQAPVWPFNQNLKMKSVIVPCTVAARCECAAKLITGEYDKVAAILVDGQPPPRSVDAAIYSLDKNDDGKTYKTWKEHKIFKTIPWFEPLVVKDPLYPDDLTKDTFYAKFGLKKKLAPENTPTLRDFMLESVFVNAAKAELPLTTGKKGVAALPFFYPKLIAKPFPQGVQSATINVSSGMLPHMLLITGMSHNQYAHPNFEMCTTKTTLNDPEFKIVDFTIFVNNRPAFRSPWKHNLDHYINFLTHNGRLKNKGLGGGIDFFKFQNENWLVPLVFDDSAGLTGVVDVCITFDRPLQKHWDLLVMKIPVEDLHIDMIRKGL